MVEVHPQAVTLRAADCDPVAGERVPGHRVHVESITFGNLESAGDVPGERRDLERRSRQVAASEIDAVAHQWPAPMHSDIANQRRTPATHVHRPDPRELAAAELTGEDRHEIQIAAPHAESSKARRADNVEPDDPPRNRAVQPPEQMINGLLRRNRQHGGSVTQRSTLWRVAPFSSAHSFPASATCPSGVIGRLFRATRRASPSLDVRRLRRACEGSERRHERPLVDPN